MSHDRTLLAVQGYMELGLFDEAVTELGTLPAEIRAREPCLSLRVAVLMAARRWEEACAACTKLRAADPSGTTGFIHGAFCLHELGRTAEARQLLLGGPASLQKEPTYHYNLGCYAAVLGEPEAARKHLRRSFELNAKFLEIARRDPDLMALRDEF